MYLNKYVKNVSIIIFILTNLFLFSISFKHYLGNDFNFILLFIICNFYIYYSFNYSNLFLDKTLSIFLWLGFFYKLCVILIFKSIIPEGAGAFNYDGKDYDKLLIFSYFGISSFLVSSILINNFFKTNNLKWEPINSKLASFYIKNRNIIYLSFLILIIFVGLTNFFTGYYQKGLLPNFEINFLLGNFIKWMLLFGLTSISCLLIEYDLKIFKKISVFVLFLFFFELVVTNLSLLSRAMIFTGSAVLFSTYFNCSKNIDKNINNSLLVNFFILFIIFSLLIFPINKIRQHLFVDAKYMSKEKAQSILLKGAKTDDLNKIIESNISEEEKLKIISEKIEKKTKETQKLDIKENFERIIFVIKNRFVGLDGMAAVTSYPENNFNLLLNGLKEKFDSNKYGFYQRTFVLPFQAGEYNPIYDRSSERHYGIIIPGILSFLSYPGSLIFLIIAVIIIHCFCSSIEILSRKFTNNSVIFSSFIGYVLGYRLIHFGYLPKQSYLIVSAILLTIFSIHLIQLYVLKLTDD